MTHNTRPADFPTDAEVDAIVQWGIYGDLLDAFVGSPEWDEHDVRTQCEADAAEFRRMGAEDCTNGLHFVPELYFVPGTAAYHAYCTGYYTARLAVAA